MTICFRRALGTLVPAMIIGAVLGAASIAPVAATVAQPVDVNLQTMLPGESRAVIQEVTVSQRARVAATEWTTAGVDADWNIRLCTDTDCTRWQDLVGTTLASGTHEIRATITMPNQLDQGATASASGSITFIEADATLPSTGATLASGALGAGIAAIVGGFVIVLIARRRRAQEEDES
ncbi:LPXTG cell wall anchor domain-containing protein [Microbacterium invictum]|uniref:LPXTG-motif cell wall-anchored protein n=1 Tax=Microbacterium invictum TaxID=515415 RepID=A0AA40VLF5_9MICO|nr:MULTISPECIES: LPXTG cell wall anchor domain-containing protein [Microbacterium]MBB4139336.1 LPXTG-motif cell wall-anchored protein [Microbacterium invictum]